MKRNRENLESDKKLYSKLLSLTLEQMDSIEEQDDKLLTDGEKHIPESYKKEVFEAVNAISRKKNRHKYLATAASTFLCLIIISIAAVNADALKFHFYRFINEIKADHIEIAYKETNETQIKKNIPDWKGFYYPETLPKGFQLSVEECSDEKEIKRMVFRSGEETICFYQMDKDGTNQQLDNENVAITEVFVHGYPGILVRKETYVTLSWLSLEKWFQIVITGDKGLSDQDVIKLANNLIYID